jgi:hypothetical protein
VPGGRIVEIDGALHEPQAEKIAIEGDVTLRFPGNRGDVVDAYGPAHDFVPGNSPYVT